MYSEYSQSEYNNQFKNYKKVRKNDRHFQAA